MMGTEKKVRKCNPNIFKPGKIKTVCVKIIFFLNAAENLHLGGR